MYTRAEINVELFATNLDRLMTRYDISNSNLARMLGVSREVVRQWRKGGFCYSKGWRESFPGEDNVQKICVALQCSLDELIKPLYASNLLWLMEEHAFDANDLAEFLGVSEAQVNAWTNAHQAPTDEEAGAICDFIRKTSGMSYAADDLFTFPKTIPLRTWAIREYIPLKRATELFELEMLDGAINSPFGIIVPADVVAPRNSKQLVIQAKRRPQWGVDGLEIFCINMNICMAKNGISNQMLADAIGASIGIISHWRTGLKVPNEAHMEAIAKVCGRSVEEMITGLLREAA